MMRRDAELLAQRLELRERIAQERALLRRDLRPLAQSLDVRSRVDGLLGRAREFATRNPLVVAGVGAALLIFKPRMLLRLTQQGLLLWRTWRSVRSLLPASLLASIGSLLR